uniref:ATP synthase CF1 subunit epsilon n=1 Tax=Porphyridium purpureum TaxID=35688 RepID=W0RYG4_PORPP|nr:ATP synthase CF1, subunit epsilon [Porphyridium purpureum]ATJ02882.1 ATP synthase CF1 subunit epsilon [Porphyridium purpureum]BAO23659.1 ATP synthase CF1, subunit epsilon [Porphyridium purpureum]
MALKIRVITPDRTIWDAEAEEAIIPSTTGQIGILKDHAPLLTALDIGVMTVRIDKIWTPIVLMGGFAEIENNQLTILVNGAEEASEIDADFAQKNLAQALNDLDKAQSGREKINAKQNLRKARARVQAVNQLKV